MKSPHFRDAVAGLFRSQPDTWISAYALMQVGGALAFRTRVSECRTQLGMDVVNKVERDRNGVAQCFYMFRPHAPAQADLLDALRLQHRLLDIVHRH